MTEKIVDPEASQPPPYGGIGASSHPPNYEAVSDPPPSYDSIFGEIKQARQESSGVFDFLKKFSFILVSTIGCTVCLAICLAIPISCIVIGVEYKKDCPVQSKIPLFLIVLGSFGIFRNLIGLWNQAKRRMEGGSEEEANVKKSTLEGIIDCFLLAWFICGNVWVYSNYEPNYHNPLSPQYCHEVVYKFAFWMITAMYIVMGTLCCCMCCVACLSVMVSE